MLRASLEPFRSNGARESCDRGAPPRNSADEFDHDAVKAKPRLASRARIIAGLSSRARWRDRVWPPPHRRDLQRRSLPRIDPTARCAPIAAGRRSTSPLQPGQCAVGQRYRTKRALPLRLIARCRRALPGDAAGAPSNDARKWDTADEGSTRGQNVGTIVLLRLSADFLGAEHRLVVAVPARHVERPHAELAHVAERHQLDRLVEFSIPKSTSKHGSRRFSSRCLFADTGRTRASVISAIRLCVD
jgi:hypothetical protein